MRDTVESWQHFIKIKSYKNLQINWKVKLNKFSDHLFALRSSSAWTSAHVHSYSILEKKNEILLADWGRYGIIWKQCNQTSHWHISNNSFPCWHVNTVPNHVGPRSNKTNVSNCIIQQIQDLQIFLRSAHNTFWNCIIFHMLPPVKHASERFWTVFKDPELLKLCPPVRQKLAIKYNSLLLCGTSVSSHLPLRSSALSIRAKGVGLLSIFSTLRCVSAD